MSNFGEYAGAEYENRELSDEKFIARILEHRLEQDRINKAELDKIPYITKWFNEKLTMDIDGAHNFTELHKSKLKKSNKSKKKAENIENRVNVRYNTSLNSARKIINGDFGLTRTGKDNRLHSTVASMKKELRPFLSYDGKPLVGVDVKSSQPYLFTQLLKPEFYEKVPGTTGKCSR